MLNILSYDFHGDWEKNVNHNAPLFAINGATDYMKKLTVVSTAKGWRTVALRRVPDGKE